MDTPPIGESHVAPPLTRVAVILELIDTVLADCEPRLTQCRTATPRQPCPVVEP